MNYQLIFMPRSGSTWVCGLLDNEALGFKNIYEVLAAPEYPLALQLIANEEATDFSPALKIEVVDRAMKRYSDKKLFGFKYEYGHIASDYAGFAQAMMHRMQKTIIMVRENPVQWALSQMHSSQLSKNNLAVNSSAVTDHYKSLTYDIDCRVLEYYMVLHKFYMSFMTAAGELFPGHLRVDYELLQQNPNELAAILREYLEIDPSANLASEFKKVRADSLQHIRNIDEVRDFLKKSNVKSDYLI